MIWDHNKERLYERSKIAYDDPVAKAFIWGSAFHWYSGDHFEAIEAVSKRWPDKKLLFTEGCVEKYVSGGAPASGERYAHDIIGDINAGACGFVDWNLVLDQNGGPNHVGNFCNAPLIADTENDTLRYDDSYYFIGHFSKFVPPGSKRIGLSRFTDKLEVCAFLRPDSAITAVVLNRGDLAIEYQIRQDGMVAPNIIPGHSIQTLLM